jgi:hypothetical protein
MSRLIDRIITGRQPVRLSLIQNRDDMMDGFRAEARKQLGNDAKEEQVSQLATDVWAGFFRNEPIEKEPFDISRLADIPVIAADDVAAYGLSLPKGTRMEDVVACMAPPFERFFVEFQNVPNEAKLHAWGALVKARDDPDTIEQIEGDEGNPRWVLELATFFENEKGKPFGPVATHVLGLAEDGTWFRHSTGDVWWGGGLVTLTQEPPDDVVQECGNNVAQLLFPVLLSLSFMNCKNVEVRPVEPPEKLSHKHHKKHGHELVRYHVLEVQQIGRILDDYRNSNQVSLRRALHACRGHFKTFTPDAPLLGKHVGTYWWEPHLRGSKEHGVVLKDYRVSAPREFGRAYREAEKSPPYQEREAPPARDPDSEGRGLAAHSRIQNQIAKLLRQYGIEPLSPTKNQPEFDIAWKAQETFYVCEVKSTTVANEEKQLRMAIGQVIRYRQKLAACGYEPIFAAIAIEQCPSDSSWEELCMDEGIILLWPDVAGIQIRNLALENDSQTPTTELD